MVNREQEAEMSKKGAWPFIIHHLLFTTFYLLFTKKPETSKTIKARKAKEVNERQRKVNWMERKGRKV